MKLLAEPPLYYTFMTAQAIPLIAYQSALQNSMASIVLFCVQASYITSHHLDNTWEHELDS